MTPEAIDKAALALKAARLDGQRLQALPDDCRPLEFDSAYAIQDRLVELLDEPVYGWKIGATSEKARQLVGISAPICARMLAPNCYTQPANLDRHRFFIRALESEFAFRLGSDLPVRDEPYRQGDIVAAIDTLHPAIEVSDSRYHDWTQSGGPSLVADNSNDGAFVLGEGTADWRNMDLLDHRVELYVNGDLAARGGGREVITGPLGALTWLANACVTRDDPLKVGQVVTTGSCTGVVMAQPGDRVEADFGALGRVTLSF